MATHGTADALAEADVPVSERVAKLDEDTGANAVDLIRSGKIQLVINSPRGRGPRADGAHIRKAAGELGIPLLTTAAAGLAAAMGMADWATHTLQVKPLQEYHESVGK